MTTLILLLPAFVLAWVAYGALRERLDDVAIPASLHGVSILLVSVGFLSMAFAGLAGGNRSLSIFVGLFIATASGVLAAAIGQRAKKTAQPTVEQIDRLLPQTQCGQCGYPGCKPYADAIASGEADINQCPPGGEAGVRALAKLLGRPVKPLNPDNGIEKPRVVALIREPECIGCTKCIQACPVDAIIGASKSMHVVIADLCTGCELCVPPCPVDCIDLVPVAW